MYELLTLTKKENPNNTIAIAGEIVSEFRFHHIQNGIRYFMCQVSSVRYSQKPDTFLVLVPEGMLTLDRPHLYKRIIVHGEIQVFKNHSSYGTKTAYYILADHAEFNEVDGPVYVNTMFLDGIIHFKPTYRKTPQGREITDITLTTVDNAGNIHNIPCIFWGRNARLAAGLATGTHLRVWARFESREYEKKFPNGATVTRTTYEASVKRFSVVDKVREA